MSKPGVLTPGLTCEVHAPVRQRCPNQSWKRIKDGTEVTLHWGPFLTVAVPEQCARSPVRVDDTLVSVCDGSGLSHQVQFNSPC